MADRILIANDNKDSLNVLHKAFMEVMIESDLTTNAASVIELIKQRHYDFILLDTNLKDADCIDLVRSIHNVNYFIPIVITGNTVEDSDIVKAIDYGADDYIIKPISTLLLVAKVKAVIRRNKLASKESSKMIMVGPFTYDTATLRLYKNKKEILLSSKENSIIKLLLDNAGEIFSKEMIYSNVWGETIIDENAIMVYINRIRQKVEDDPAKPKYLQTVRGVGYRFDAK